MGEQVERLLQRSRGGVAGCSDLGEGLQGAAMGSRVGEKWLILRVKCHATLLSERKIAAKH